MHVEAADITFILAMPQNIKIWKISLLLLIGLFAFLYIFSSTVADVYSLVRDPVAGITNRFDEERGESIIERVVPKGPADMAGIAEGDVVLEINGRVIQSEMDLEDPYPGVHAGGKVEFKIRRDHRTLLINFVAASRGRVYTRALFLGVLPGIIFSYSLLIIGLFVLLKKINDRTAHIFFLMVIFWALAMWGTFPYGSQTLIKLLPDWFGWVRLFFFPVALGLLLHFTLIFPFEKVSYRKHRKLYYFIAYGSVLLIVPFAGATIQRIDWSNKILDYGWGIWFSVNFFLAVTMLGHSRAKAPTPRMAEQAKLILRGTTYALALPTGLYYLPLNFANTRLPYSEFLLLLIVFWPLTLAYTIIKHRFMDINFIIKRGVAYALVSGVVIAAYFVLVVGLGRVILLATGSTSQMFTIVATLVIAIFFNPIKNQIQEFVERRFFPSKYVYHEAVRVFNHKLVRIVDLAELQELLQEFLTESMRISPVVLLWQNPRSNHFSVLRATGLTVEDLPMFSLDDAVIQRLTRQGKLLDCSLLDDSPDAVPDEERNRWAQLKAELVLPLQPRKNLRGLISLGQKTDGESFYKEDIELLETLNDQINISLANALLTEQLREQERLRKELEVARRIQLSSLPQSDPIVEGLDVSGISVPALEVGGDYYDYLLLPDGRFGVVVGDVSGKGTSAALYMSQLKGILKTASKFHSSLKDLMIEVNAITFDSLEPRAFITIICGAFDFGTKNFRFVRAGHLPLIHFSQKKNICHELRPKGIGVGLEAGHLFGRELEEVEIKFEPGDVFAFYSDGIVEACSPEGQEFDTAEIKRIISGNGEQSALVLREKIIERVQNFVGQAPQKDDITVVVAKVKNTF